MIIIANDQTPEVIKPGEESLNFPTALETAQRTSVLSASIWPAALPAWSNHFGSEVLPHFLIERVTVIGLVAHEPLGHLNHESLLQSSADSFTSAGLALSVQTATGRPLRSATAMILVPFARLVFPTHSPLFWREQSCRRRMLR